MLNNCVNLKKEYDMFKIGDKVFYATDPYNTTDCTGIVDGVVNAIEMVQSLDGLEVTRYKVSFGLLDSDRYIDKEKLFLTKEEALKSLQQHVTETISRLESKLEKYKSLIIP